MKMLEIIYLPAFKDNYIWLGINHILRQAFVVDPGEALPVIAYLEKHALSLTAIFLTHKHPDHTGGVPQLIKSYPGTPIYANALERLPFITHPLQDGEQIKLSMCEAPFTLMHVPGHTLEHSVYHTNSILFSGDTLFSAGCGRVFEGTMASMLASLDKIAALPSETLVYCGHEYTLSNLNFARTVEPDNNDIVARIAWAKQRLLEGESTVPSTIQVEKLINPFLRCDQKSVIQAVENHIGTQVEDRVSVFKILREWKNQFTG